MPNPNVATETPSVDPTGLEDAIFGTDNQEEGAAKTEVKDDEGAENESEESTDDNQNDDTADSEDQSQETDESSEEEESDDESEDEDAKSYRIGNQVFASANDAVSEATRVIGRNAQLAGDLRRAESEKANVEAQLQEALEANKQWVEWAKAQENGENLPAPIYDPEKIAEQVAQTLEGREARRTARVSLEKEIDAIIALPNFRDVAPIVDSIADKTNPLTGKLYTPNEAYDFAVAHLGLDNLRKKQGGQVKQPKKMDRSALKGAAARPASARMSNTPKAKQETSFADEMLREQIL